MGMGGGYDDALGAGSGADNGPAAKFNEHDSGGNGGMTDGGIGTVVGQVQTWGEEED